MIPEQQRIDSSGKKKEVKKKKRAEPSNGTLRKGRGDRSGVKSAPFVCPRPPWVKFVRLWNKKKNRQTENKVSFNTVKYGEVLGLKMPLNSLQNPANAWPLRLPAQASRHAIGISGCSAGNSDL